MLGKIYRIIVGLILTGLVLIGALAIFSFLPIPGNYQLFIVQSGSMEPTVHTGSLIFVKPASEYKVEDIVTMKIKNSKETVTHRITEIIKENGKISFKTKGDANKSEDSGEVAEDEIVGKLIFKIPYLGYPVSFSKTSQGFILLIVIPSVIIIYEELRKIKKEIGKKLDYRKRIKKRKSQSKTKSKSEKFLDEVNKKNNKNDEEEL